MRLLNPRLLGVPLPLNRDLQKNGNSRPCSRGRRPRRLAPSSWLGFAVTLEKEAALGTR
ncbi:MAG: hypothetical protein ACLTYN_04615 [Dysosmobacter welbionis]